MLRMSITASRTRYQQSERASPAQDKLRLNRWSQRTFEQSFFAKGQPAVRERMNQS